MLSHVLGKSTVCHTSPRRTCCPTNLSCLWLSKKIQRIFRDIQRVVLYIVSQLPDAVLGAVVSGLSYRPSCRAKRRTLCPCGLDEDGLRSPLDHAGKSNQQKLKMRTWGLCAVFPSFSLDPDFFIVMMVRLKECRSITPQSYRRQTGPKSARLLPASSKYPGTSWDSETRELFIMWAPDRPRQFSRLTYGTQSFMERLCGYVTEHRAGGEDQSRW